MCIRDRGGLAGLGVGAGLDGEQRADPGVHDPGDFGGDLLEGLVVAATEAVADSGQVGFGLGQGPFPGVADGAGFFAGPDVGDSQVVAAAGLGVGGGVGGEQPTPAGPVLRWQGLLTTYPTTDP